MAGHSKWHNIQARKSVQDAKRGKAFTKITKELMLATKAGGADTALNNRLKTAIAAAKAINLPKDKIEQAIKKGSGDLGGANFEEIVYEGYAPGGIAVMIETATDNRNRTVADVRAIMSKRGGSLGESGSVGWMFDRKGVLTFPKTYSEDQLMEVGLDAGADDIVDEDEVWEVRVPMELFAAVQDAFEKAGITAASAELARIPQNLIALDVENARKVIALIDALEDYDDVQKVYGNFDISDEVAEQL